MKQRQLQNYSKEPFKHSVVGQGVLIQVSNKYCANFSQHLHKLHLALKGAYIRM